MRFRNGYYLIFKRLIKLASIYNDNVNRNYPTSMRITQIDRHSFEITIVLSQKNIFHYSCNNLQQ